MTNKYLLVPIFASTRSFIIFGTIVICAIVKRSISLPNWPPSSLIIEMPVKTRKRPMLCTFVL